MMRNAKLLTAVAVASLGLPPPHSFAQFFPFPDLTVKITGNVGTSCAGPLLMRLTIPFEIRNVGKVAAVSPSPFAQWAVILDAGGGPRVPELPWSTSGPTQLLPQKALTFKGQPLLRQVPNFVGLPVGFPKSYQVMFNIVVDPANFILEINKDNNIVEMGILFNNKPKPANLEPARCN
jgi:hypothetical protein